VSDDIRSWWRNCTLTADDETRAIDVVEDALKPLGEGTLHIRKLIACFECCHHKALRHAEIIIAAIGSGRTDKGQGRPNPERLDARERQYDAITEALSAWCLGRPVGSDRRIGEYSGGDLVSVLGEPTPPKVWQVQGVMEKVRRFRDRKQRWNAAYEPLVGGTPHGANGDFRQRTMRVLIRNTENGRPCEISLGQAIDALTGCSWNFIENLRNILGAIGGEVHPLSPLALHACNLTLNPACARLRTVASAMRAFGNAQAPSGGSAQAILAVLGESTAVKRWLAASLAKTILLQLRA
jgi:hypothetical protein